MKYSHILLSLFLFLPSLNSNAQTWKWGIGNAPFPGIAESAPTATDPSGNVFLGGSYLNADTIRFGTCTTGKPRTHNAIFVVKADSSGNFLWARSMDCASITMMSIATDNAGNLYVLALYKDTACHVGSVSVSNPADYYMNIAVKYSPSGSVVWAKNVVAVGTSMATFIGGIKPDAAGNVYVASNFYLSSTTVGGTTLTNHHGPTSNDVYIAKFDTLCSPIWAIGFGGNRNDVANCITVSPVGNISITGYFLSDTMIIGTDTLLNPSSGATNMTYLAQFDSSGHPRWGFTAAPNTNVYAVSAGDSGFVYTAGSINGTAILGHDTMVSYSLDPLVVKYDSSGHEVWAREATGIPTSSAAGIGYAIDVDQCGNIWECGRADGRMRFDTSIVDTPYTAFFPLFIAAYDPNGNYIINSGSQIPALNGDDATYGLAAAWQSGTVYVGGDYENTSVVVGPDTLAMPPYACEYAMLAKYQMPSCTPSHGDTSTLGNHGQPAGKAIINIYPNPAADAITISNTAPFADGTTAALYDLAGRQIKYAPLSGNSTSISVSDLAPGVYFCKIVQTGNVVEIKKIVVVR